MGAYIKNTLSHLPFCHQIYANLTFSPFARPFALHLPPFVHLPVLAFSLSSVHLPVHLSHLPDPKSATLKKP